MTLPSSGQISMSQINTELGRSSTAQISLNDAENGDYGAINQNSASKPNASNPAAMSEWYGYNHNAGGTMLPHSFVIKVPAELDNCYDACYLPTCEATVWSAEAGGPIELGSTLYIDQAGTIELYSGSFGYESWCFNYHSNGPAGQFCDLCPC